jgi:hypothetical protein
LIALVPCLALCALSSAADPPVVGFWSKVTVKGVETWTSQGFGTKGTAVFTFSAAASTPASCSSEPTRAVVDITEIGGAMTASILQSAKLIGQPVTVYGTGSCPTKGNIENVSHVVEE